jgi:hypothetical protein
MGYLERFITEQRLADVFLFDPREENQYLGFDKERLTRAFSPAIVIGRHPGGNRPCPACRG